jgi:nucleotide-binding universal stress UspA family protein
VTTARRILVAVHDASDSLAAARVAVALAAARGARLRVVHVAADGGLGERVEAISGRPAAGARAGRARDSLLARVAALARAAGVDAETKVLEGDVAPTVLRDAHRWRADLLVVGKSASSATGDPYVGSQTRHVLEFADQPVLVVPAPARR